jgi:protein involved in polysaccharide export with SLBB domain
MYIAALIENTATFIFIRYNKLIPMLKKALYILYFIYLLTAIDTYAQVDTLTSDSLLNKQAQQLGISPEQLIKLKSYQSNPQAPSQNSPKMEKQPLGKFAVQVNKPINYYRVNEFKNRPPEDTLTAFGYKIFSTSPSSFEPGLNLPVPENYVFGPGDQIVLTLWGETQLQENLTVNKEGNIYIPNVGQVSVNGLTLNELKGKLRSVLSKTYSSLNANSEGEPRTYLDISTGTLRTVKIYVMGEVANPGGYALPSLSTSFTALYYAGGPTINGSLRDIRVIRDGKIISNVDFYDYLVKGDKSKDVQLQDEDIVFVPPAGNRAAIYGAVFRPGIYELKEGEQLKDLLQYCGGVNVNAYYQTVHVERVVPFSQRDKYKNDMLNIDLNYSSANDLKSSPYVLNDGDAVDIPEINNLPENRLAIYGSIRKPGNYELLDSSMTVSDLISRAGGLLPDAFTGKALLQRTFPTGKKEILSFNVEKALEGVSSDNFRLQNRDQITIYNIESIFPTKTVEIDGAVRTPGVYKRYKSMTLSDLIILAGGLTDSALTKNIEIARMDSTSPDIFAHRYIVSLPADYWNVPKDKDFLLEDYDRVLVKSDPNRNYSHSVYVSGEVMYPGRYTLLQENEKIYDIIKQAGGFRDKAYTQGMAVLRHNALFSTLKNEIVPDTILKKIKDIPIYNKSIIKDEFTNRVPILWNEIKDDTSSIYNIKLEPGDSVVVPKNPNVVYVVGEVGLPSYVPYKEGAGLGYYIEQAGGYTENSDKGYEIVILPNGKKWEPSGWFFIPNPEILAGSTIIVPSVLPSSSDFWPIVRDVAAFVTSTAVLILTVKSLSK